MSGDAARSLHPRFPKLDPAVVQGYLDAPETVVAEIVDGELSLMPRPRPRHAHAATRLAGEFRPFGNPRGDEPGGWVLLIEPELELGAKPDVLIPDLAGWRRERVPPGFLQAGHRQREAAHRAQIGREQLAHLGFAAHDEHGAHGAGTLAAFVEGCVSGGKKGRVVVHVAHPALCP